MTIKSVGDVVALLVYTSRQVLTNEEYCFDVGGHLQLSRLEVFGAETTEKFLSGQDLNRRPQDWLTSALTMAHHAPPTP